MAGDHTVKLSRSFTCLKITQIVFNICVLGFSAYIVYYDPGSAPIMSTVTVSISTISRMLEDLC